ncbi:MAG: hypothetical protein Q8898_16060, partial [Bacillota bacterium]|nr:hypothetical protein [Bacillota bacterium]
MLAALDENEDVLEPSSWKNLLFSRHEESYYGTVLEFGSFEGTDGVIVNGWQLVSLFARESFNRFVHWDWSNEAEVCLAAAHSLYEGILEKDWLPDFSAWENGNFRWQLPERVKNEFDPSFWEQPLNEADDSMTPFGDERLSDGDDLLPSLLEQSLADSFTSKEEAITDTANFTKSNQTPLSEGKQNVGNGPV